MHAKLTLIGFNNYTAGSIFELLTIPEGLDRDTVINTILLEFGECEVYYSNPEFFRNAVGIWSKKWRFTIERWLNLIKQEYNPLYNIDRFEDVDDSTKTEQTATLNRDSDTTTHNDSTGAYLDNGGTTSTSTGESYRNTYDSDTYHKTDKQEQTGSTTNTATGSNNGTVDGTEAIKETSTGNSDTDTTFKHRAHFYGNGGVTTSQKMFNEEAETVRFNIYEEVAELFARDLLIDSFF